MELIGAIMGNGQTDGQIRSRIRWHHKPVSLRKKISPHFILQCTILQLLYSLPSVNLLWVNRNFWAS